MDREVIVKDVFGSKLCIGNQIIYTYNQSFRKGRIVRFTRSNYIVVDNWPTGKYITIEGRRRYVTRDIPKSLGPYKECVLSHESIDLSSFTE